MIFDFHPMGDRIGDSMDGFQKIWGLFAVYKIVIFLFARILSANKLAGFIINLKTDLKELVHESTQFLVSLIQKWL